jgi:transaldolase/glucose-6-phosphate isomerase
MLNTIDYSLPDDINTAFQGELKNWNSNKKINRIWAKDASIWTSEDEGKWLGWLNIVDEELGNVTKYREFYKDISGTGFNDVLLLGMGGSSLCPEVLGMTFSKSNFHILDSTVPAQVKTVENKIDLEKTLFIVASKSGSTLEPNCFKQYFFQKVAEKVGRENAGKQFVAITDPGSKMEHIAKDDGFRHIFYGKPEIGGRFSALSAFGLTAAASMGLDVEQLLYHAKEMTEACNDPDANANPGALLGLILGVCHKLGRDKLTIFTSPEIHVLGAWLEQLIAESTGKDGVAIVPVDREPIEAADTYGDDRLFTFLSVKGGSNFDSEFASLTATGHPAAKIELDSVDNIGQEFFRWEFATAVAGSIMEINPFNQPDVEAAKIAARKLTDEYEERGELPAETPFFQDSEFALFTSDFEAANLTTSAEHQTAKYLFETFLASVRPGADYFALLAYIEMNDEHQRLLQSIRESALRRHRCATCLGFGPRFLHSTGQAYKGGANNGVFLQITSDDAFDLPVPAQKYTFGVVKAAQARGDFQVLLDRGRRALRVHLGSDVSAALQKLASLI